MKTYILKTISNELYCGKTNNIDRRMKEHINSVSNSWFNSKNRRTFQIILIIDLDCEKEIKRFGVCKFYNSIKKVSLS
jgi:predicted GIY-YIG superfamily endonuclease